MNRERFGGFIRDLRSEKNMTQAELAQKLHVSYKTISKWETGAGLPDVSMLEPLARELGVSVSELFRCDRNPENISVENESQIVSGVSEILSYKRKVELRNVAIVAGVVALAVLILLLLDYMTPFAFLVTVLPPILLAAAAALVLISMYRQKKNAAGRIMIAAAAVLAAAFVYIVFFIPKEISVYVDRGSYEVVSEDEMTKYAMYGVNFNDEYPFSGNYVDSALQLCDFSETRTIGGEEFDIYTSEILKDLLWDCEEITEISVHKGFLYIYYTGYGKEINLTYTSDELTYRGIYYSDTDTCVITEGGETRLYRNFRHGNTVTWTE